MFYPKLILLKLIFVLIFFTSSLWAFPEQGKWDYQLNLTERYFGVFKSLFKDSTIYVKVLCNTEDQENNLIKINWLIRQTPCWDEYAALDLLTLQEKKGAWATYFESPNSQSLLSEVGEKTFIVTPPAYEHRCDSTISLNEFFPKKNLKSEKREASNNTDLARIRVSSNSNPVYTVTEDGIYLFIIKMESILDKPFSANVHIEMKSEFGYLSAADWPLLTFYGGMCTLYVVYGMAWLVLSFCQWKDLLRIQFWVGAVILLGMIEMAVFYAEYQNINYSGISVAGAVLTAEVISCGKRTLARMLVVIVSIGFGIVKPRLGTTLHRIIIVGFIYFVLASTESALRILHPVNGPSSRALMAGIPLSILDAIICWWIFHSLLSTTRTLRLRRNLVKLGLYRHFTNTLIFAVVASVAFMIWSIKFIKTAQCLRDWKEIWMDEAFWHVLFGVILLVIMYLFRPTNNNQRYSFSPLIDNIDDDDEEDLVVNEAFGNMKLRPKTKGNQDGMITKNRNANLDEELKWVEENIPADLGEGDLPALDSEEELISTKFELSKMQ